MCTCIICKKNWNEKTLFRANNFETIRK